MQDDRLLQINGVSLLGRSNSDTMNLLRQALRLRSSTSPDCIDLVIARRRRISSASTQHSERDPSVKTGDGVHETTPGKRADRPVEEELGVPSRSSRNKLPAPPPPTKRSVSYQRANNSDLTLASPTDGIGLHIEADESTAAAAGFAGVSNPAAAARGRSATPLVMMTPSSGMAAPTITGGRTETVLIETEGGERKQHGNTKVKVGNDNYQINIERSLKSGVFFSI